MTPSLDISCDSDRHTAQLEASNRTANVSERTSPPAQHLAAPDAISPRQRWAHLLVLDIINANLPLARLADHLKIPFDTLIGYINTPEVQAEIEAYEQLNNLRARLLGETARPISLRKLLEVLESPPPKLTGRDTDADQRFLHQHAELIRRTATTIARESRALAPKPVLAAKPPRESQEGTQSAPQHTSSGSSCNASTTTTDNRARQGVPPVPAEHTSVGEAELVPDAPTPPTSSDTPGRTEPPARQSPTAALRAAAGSMHTLRAPSRRARDRPAA